MPDCTNSLSQREPIETRAQQASRSLAVPALGPFDTSTWDSTSAALGCAPALPLGQAWLPSTQENFRPGIVRLGWQEARIIVAARLEDDRIFTRPAANNHQLWELGDVFEIFLRDAEREDYLELHVAPYGDRSQLRFASGRSVVELRKGVGRIESFAVKTPLFDFRVRTETGGWEIFAQVPASSLGLQVASLRGRAVFASFSRYDYSDECGPAVLSSTSPHVKPDFHRQQEWTKLIFC